MEISFWKVPNIFIKEKLLKRNLGFGNFTEPSYGRYVMILAKLRAKIHFYRLIRV